MRALPLALVLGLAGIAPAAAQPRPIGYVVRLAPTVHGRATQPPGTPKSLKKGDAVVEDMEVATDKQAGANVTVEGPKRGAVRLAAETRVVFKRWLINAARGQDIPFLVQLGHFLAAFSPHQDGRHTVFIDTPTAHIRLEGTLIDVQVAPDGGTVVTVREDHSGPLAGLLGRTTPDLNPSFRQFCAGLKALAGGRASRHTG